MTNLTRRALLSNLFAAAFAAVAAPLKPLPPPGTWLAFDAEGDIYGIGDTREAALAAARRELVGEIERADAELAEDWWKCLDTLDVAHTTLPRVVLRGLTNARTNVWDSLAR
jgi:hypothetical protein